MRLDMVSIETISHSVVNPIELAGHWKVMRDDRGFSDSNIHGRSPEYIPRDRWGALTAQRSPRRSDHHREWGRGTANGNVFVPETTGCVSPGHHQTN